MELVEKKSLSNNGCVEEFGEAAILDDAQMLIHPSIEQSLSLKFVLGQAGFASATASLSLPSFRLSSREQKSLRSEVDVPKFCLYLVASWSPLVFPLAKGECDVLFDYQSPGRRKSVDDVTTYFHFARNQEIVVIALKQICY